MPTVAVSGLLSSTVAPAATGAEDAGDGRLAAGFDGVVAVAVGAVGELPVEDQAAHLLPAQHDAAVRGQVAGVAQPERKLDPGSELGVRHVRDLADDQVRDADDHLRLRSGAGAVVRADGVLERAGGADRGARVRPHGEVDVRLLGDVLVDAGEDLPGGRAPRVVDRDARDAGQVPGIDDEGLVRLKRDIRPAVVERPAHVDRLRGRPNVELLVRVDHGVGLRRQGEGLAARAADPGARASTTAASAVPSTVRWEVMPVRYVRCPEGCPHVNHGFVWVFLQGGRRPAWTMIRGMALRPTWDNEVRAPPPG